MPEGVEFSKNSLRNINTGLYHRRLGEGGIYIIHCGRLSASRFAMSMDLKVYLSSEKHERRPLFLISLSAILTLLEYFESRTQNKYADNYFIFSTYMFQVCQNELKPDSQNNRQVIPIFRRR